MSLTSKMEELLESNPRPNQIDSESFHLDALKRYKDKRFYISWVLL